jgi:hypothetical protein
MLDAKQMFPLSQALKDAMGKYAAAHDMSVAELIRKSVAKVIGFKLEPTETHRKYATVEERVEAQKERTAERRALEKKLYDDYMRDHRK